MCVRKCYYSQLNLDPNCVYHRAAALAAGQAITEADTGTEMSIAKVTAISAYSKGFCCSCGPGVAYLFEKTDDKEFYRKSREFKVFSMI